MKKTIFIPLLLIGYLILATTLNSCKTTEALSGRSGAQIWGENCVRCHNPPDPATFSDQEWEVAGMHMQIRANLTHEELEKVTEFLKSAN
jgi:mono/diheme cytochrome c family protein